jgi:hypothetical protein
MKIRTTLLGVAAVIALGPLASACQKEPAEQPHEAQAPTAAPTNDNDLSTSRQAIAWSQDRLTELDAAVSAVEADAASLDAETRSRAERRLVDLRAARDAYRAKATEVTAHAGAWTDAQVDDARRSLDESWTAFDTSLDAYLQETEANLATRQAVLEARARARQDATRKAIEDLRSRARDLSAEERAKAETRIAALEAQERQAQERIGRLQDASNESWLTVKRSTAEAQRLFAETYLSIRQSFENVEQDETDQ